MSRLKKILRNLIILAVLFTIFIMRTGLFLNPISAHEHSEKSLHFGPSEIVHIQDYAKNIHILGKFDNWISCNTVNRVAYLLWRARGSSQFENDKSKALDYSWGYYEDYYKVYGAINDSRIKRVVLTVDNEEVLSQTEFHDALFLFTLELDIDENFPFIGIKAYDQSDKIIFEKSREG
jgi:hypothetical protein